MTHRTVAERSINLTKSVDMAVPVWLPLRARSEGCHHAGNRRSCVPWNGWGRESTAHGAAVRRHAARSAPRHTVCAMALRVDVAVRHHLGALLSELRSARKDADLPLRALAARLSVTVTSVADWEAGRDDPTMSHFIGWARELGFRLAIVDPQDSPGLTSGQLDEGESWEMHEMRRLAAALWTRRRSRQMSQAALAAEIGVGRISMQRWESAQVFPRPIAFLVWASALECSVALRRSTIQTTHSATHTPAAPE